MKKFVCVVTALAVLLGLTSCSMNNGVLSKVRTVQKDSEWWNDSVTMVTPDEIKVAVNDKLSDMSSHYYAPDEDSIILGFVVYAKDADKLISQNLLRHYSYDGEMLGQILLEEYFGSDAQSYFPEVIYKSGEKYFAVICQYHEKESKTVRQGYELDFEKGTLKNPFSLDVPDDGTMFSSVNEIVSVGDKLVYLAHSSDLYGEGTYRICVNENGDLRSFVPKFDPNVTLDYIHNLMNVDGTPAFIAEVTANGRSKQLYCTVDINTLEMKISETDPSLDIESAEYVPGKGLFNCDNKKIYKLDPVNGKSSLVMDLKNSFITGQFDSEERIVFASDDKVVFFAEKQSAAGGYSTSYVVSLTKADENPNAGKKILTLANLDWMSEQEWTAVNEFNRNSGKYFVEASEKYYESAMEVWHKENWAYDRSLIISYESNAVDLLMADIREGTGPDLVIYGKDSAQLNNTKYLIDLSDRINSDKNINSGGYMDFILQPNGIDGKHYRLAYSFTVDGFMTMDSFLDDGAAGLTFEQYDKLIKEHNNGRSVLTDNDLVLLELLVKRSDCITYSDDGRFSIDNDNFRKIADYIKSVPDEMEYDNVLGGPGKNTEILQNLFGEWFMRDYGRNYKNYKIIGIPSPDGHAETINGRGIGITSCCSLQDGAWEFVLKMMSPEIQILDTIGNPVLKSTCKAALENYIIDNNKRMSGRNDPTGFVMSKDMVGWYMDQVSDAITVPDTDSTVIVIMNEEMPAYFEGQKSLDDVIGIIENRVNLMLKERR